jgi:O-antigen ligase
MWFVIFIVGLVVVVYKMVREPIWAAMAAGYIYFAIPHLEFSAPAAPYQAAFWAIAAVSSFRYYKEYARWGERELEARGLEAALGAVAEVRGPMKEALVQAAVPGAMPGDLRRAMLEAGEEQAIEHVDRHAPKAIALSTRRAVINGLQRASEAGEQEALRVIDQGRHLNRGNLQVAVASRALPLFDQELDAGLEGFVRENARAEVKLWWQEKIRRADEGPLGMPLPNGPLAGLVKNPGFWLHLAFIALTWYGVEVALYDKIAPASRAEVAQLLLIPLVAIIFSVRNEQHFKLFTYAWMLGVFHLAMNGVTYWLQYGGRADNAGGQGGEANFLGGVIVTVAPLAFSMAINMPTTLERFIGLGAAGAYTLGVLASGSRAGLLALIASLAYWLLHTQRKGFAAGLAMLGVSGFLVVAPDDFWEKMGTIFGEKDKNPWVQSPVEPSKHERLVLWALATKIYNEHPVWGIGPMNYPIVSGQETDFTDAYMGQRGLQAHNTWLQLLAEYGTIGGIVWAGAFVLSILCFRFARYQLKGYPGYEWFPAMCLGFEAGAIGSAIVLTFNSFQWYDYIYWHIVFGPVAFEVARQLKARLDWLKPGEFVARLPPARYGPPRAGGLELPDAVIEEEPPTPFDSRLPATR